MMDSNPRGSDWRSILLVIFAMGGVILTLGAAMVIFVLLVTKSDAFPELNASPLTSVLTATTLIAIGLLLLPVAWLSLKRLRGLNFDSFFLPPLRAWEWVAIPSLWLLILTLASLYHDAPGAVWYIPLLHFLSIALPLYFVLRIVLNHISLGSSQRAWTVFGVGMTISPLIAISAEVIFMLLGALAVVIYLGINPESTQDIERMIDQFQRAADPTALLYQVGPLVKSPLTLLAALTFLSFLVPIIEEIAKSLGVWFVSDRLRFPAQGFALGALAGAGFALAESLSASLTADDTWGLTLSMRAISGSMHILASGMFGWGIAYTRLKNRPLRLAGMALLSILLHSAWNAGAVLSVWGGARLVLAVPGVDYLGAIAAAGGAGLLLFLIAGMLVSFFVLNQRLRSAAEQERPSHIQIEEPGAPPL